MNLHSALAENLLPNPADGGAFANMLSTSVKVSIARYPRHNKSKRCWTRC